MAARDYPFTTKRHVDSLPWPEAYSTKHEDELSMLASAFTARYGSWGFYEKRSWLEGLAVPRTA